MHALPCRSTWWDIALAQASRTLFPPDGDRPTADPDEGVQGQAGTSPGGSIETEWAVAARACSIAPCWIVQAHDLLGSTNDEALDQARQGAPDGTVIWARAQTAGRGRRGRTWSSPEGNLYLSVVLRDVGPATPQLGFVAALAVADAVDKMCGTARARLKWPNDVLLDGAKLAGLLLEMEQTSHGVATVLGIGVNLRHFPPDAAYPATSLRAHCVEASVDAMLAHVLTAFGSRRDQWVNEGFDRIRSEWALRGHRRGEGLKLKVLGREMTGEFVGLDADGSLLAQIAGKIERFSATEIMSR